MPVLLLVLLLLVPRAYAQEDPAATVEAGAGTRWMLASGFGHTVFHTGNLERFAATVADLSGGALAVDVKSGGRLLPLPAIADGVARGEVQAGELLLSDLSESEPLYGADAVPFLATGFAKADKLWRSSRETVARRLEASGLTLLYAVPWPPQGLFSKRPVERLADFAGQGIRVYDPATQALAKAMGARPLRLSADQLGAAMAGDELSLMWLPASTGVAIDAPYHFAYYYDAQAWLPKNAVVANTAAVVALAPAAREALFESARLAEENGWKLSRRLHLERTAAVRLRGATVAPLPTELRREFAEVGRQLGLEWTRRAGDDAIAIIDRFYAPP